ncbi:serine/arginine repetitive matrix protein 1-like [Panicum virgatum]|uniref:serine/arginine repetitive matrix protein 1-like n=1 Tax=Panicum virgatum TaxID=38727 RepID=UPI0019D50D93|nr:serine/arginine repetitive matrix protein 1-like [Panicum virgatum]XP_039784399.1 serine/arginine repetitive matrix protein 1-like [Panicum virgatum]XP_039784400.1 serine/arginine repetitive matrix protein 1-like [Panicum virgatum]XP_039784401.1 serine/arginine repetitive matrix protein 1-like [Panicum virgatum]XP_039784402.1 serine/arginine repetitive matrix protein 1-like [Panicum virgatum]XP_039784403.1 serine/arginine repetitive matrix protein 1-like [Panicum virgatum]XP_039784404.1 se
MIYGVYCLMLACCGKKNPPIRSLRKDPVHGSFECSPTPVPHDRLRLPPPSSFGLALHRRSPPSEPWVSLAALQASLRAPTLPPLASLAVLPIGVAGPTRPRRLSSSRTGRRRRPSTPPLATEARLPARALLLLALPRPDSCRSSAPAVLTRRSPSIPADVAHAMRCRQRRRAGRPSPFADTYATRPSQQAARPARRSEPPSRRTAAHGQRRSPRGAGGAPHMRTPALPARRLRSSVRGSRPALPPRSRLPPLASPPSASHGTRHLRARAGRRSPVAPPSPVAHGSPSPLHAHRTPVISRTPAAAAKAIAAMPHLDGETD